MAILGLITARGGSKGIPKKNIAICAGRPLLAYTAEAALAAKCLDRVILSTDDEAIANVGIELGLEVPFLRPAELASDTATSLDVVIHALEWFEKHGQIIDTVVLLQPTSPLRTAQQICDAVALFNSKKPDALVSVVEVPHQYHPNALMRMEGDRLTPLMTDSKMVLRRQDQQRLYARNGPSILILKADQAKKGSFYNGLTIPFVMSIRDSLDIDTIEDFELAATILSQPSQ